MVKKAPKTILSKITTKAVIAQNKEAVKAFKYYKKTIGLLDRASILIGKKTAFRAATGSSINSKIENYGVASTTSQTI